MQPSVVEMIQSKKHAPKSITHNYISVRRMNNDDRPHILETFKWPYLSSASSDQILLQGGFFEVGGRNGTISGCIKFKIAAILKCQMAISWQWVTRSTSHLVLGWVSQRRQTEWCYFCLDQIQDGSWQQFSKFQMATSLQQVTRSTSCMYGRYTLTSGAISQC